MEFTREVFLLEVVMEVRNRVMSRFAAELKERGCKKRKDGMTLQMGLDYHKTPKCELPGGYWVEFA